MSGALALARAELIMLVRNRTAAFNSILVPLGLGAVWILTNPPEQAASFGAVLQLTVVAGMTVTSTATIVLVARRNQQVLQRWRSSGASTPTILGGTLAPLCGLLVVQAAIMFGATAYATGTAPARPFLLGTAVVLAGALAASLGFATAGFTRSVDSANITAFPAMAALFGGGMWANTAELGEASWAMLATGGGAVAQLVRLAWDGLPEGADLVGATAPALGMIVVLTAVLAAIAGRRFRWGPRT